MTSAPLKQSSPNSLYQQAVECIKKGNYAEAKTLLEQCMEEEETALAAHNLGVIYHKEGDNDKAIQYFDRAVNLDPTHTQSYINAAEIFRHTGHPLHAMASYGRAIITRPEDLILKEKFVDIARSCKFAQFNPQMKTLYLECLQAPSIDFSNMGRSWFSLLRRDPAFAKTYKTLNKKNFNAFENAFTRLPDHKALIEPYFLLGMKKQVRVSDMACEKFLTHLRRMMLALLEREDRFLSSRDFVKLAEALAHYCFHTEYVFDFTDEEKRKIDALRKSAATPESIAVVACYMSLHTLENAGEIKREFASSAIADLVKCQITDFTEQQKAKKEIESLTETTDAVSRKVKEQYEESPYPRWTSYAKVMYDEGIEGSLQDRKAQILVAGCGTGHEAIELAHVFPNADVLAIDLSYASLAYGAIKAREFGIKNISFKQADILELHGLGQNFDYIASSGVLHHMEDPKAGWRVVSGLLKPGGLMRLCLYSKLARDAITNAQKVIQRKNYTSSTDDIRRFRQDAKKLLKRRDYKRLTNYIDFYSLSECRDLLFHVQEHHFTLPEIKAWLDEAGMEFLGFYIAGETLAQYRKLYPHDPSATNLDYWAEFEKKYPDSFIGMYRLWLRKIKP